MGKAVIIYIMGLSLIVGIGLYNINSSSTDAVDNYINYYGSTMTRNIAASGANIGCSDAFLDPMIKTKYSNISFMDGKLNVRMVDAGNQRFVISVGSLDLGPKTMRDTIIAELRKETLARYAWFTNVEANKGGQPTSWSTGDTAWGPAHTNDKFNINGSPVFMKKATAWQKAVPTKHDALWNGGYEWGIKIPYPTNLDDFVSAATGGSGRFVDNSDAYVQFNPTGSVRLRVPSTGYDSTFASTTAFTQNGAFAVTRGNLYVEGTVLGDLAIGAVTLAGGGGNVFLTGDIRYKTDPLVNPASTDKLGVYAENDITVTYDDSNPAAYYNRRIDGSIFSLKSWFEVEDAKVYAPRGRLTTLGAMMQYYRGAIGVVNPGSGTLESGYFKNFRFDERLPLSPPKYYPSSGRYTLFSWREN